MQEKDCDPEHEDNSVPDEDDKKDMEEEGIDDEKSIEWTGENDVIGTSYATTQSSAISMSGIMSRQIKYDWQADNFRV